MGKLTLSVDDTVILRAKQYAKLRGISISEMVQAYLAAVAGDAPILRSVRGVLNRAEIDDYREHLSAKFRWARPA
jgi:hypothetical protein